MKESHPDPLVRVMALHALAYCERLFFLEEVEEIRLANERVHAGRADHAEWDITEAENRQGFEISNEAIGIQGKLDAIRYRESGWIPYEIKRGRAFRAEDGNWEPWDADRLQVLAYAMLLEEETGKPVSEGRIHYLASSTTVRVTLDQEGRTSVIDAVHRAKTIRESVTRPPVTLEPRKCIKCSLAPVCLPEEERLSHETEERDKAVRLFPKNQLAESFT